MNFRCLLAIPLLVLAALGSHGQPAPTALNLDFEQVNPRTHRPLGWTAPTQNGYLMAADSVTRHGGRYALRLQSPSAVRKAGEFGVATWQLPANFWGKRITLTGFLKTDQVQNGFASMWLRVNNDEGTIAFDNMANQQVQGTTDWTEYSITLPLADEARVIYFGLILPATGTAWLDDLSLTVDNKPLTKAAAKAIPYYKAEKDTAFRRGSGIELEKLSELQTTNLALLGRVWGFAKYYHPAVARGDYNFDAELLRVLPKVLAAPSPAENSAVLSTWLAGLGPVPPCRGCREPAAKDVRLQPDLAWLTDTRQLSPALSQQLVQLRQNRNQGPHYYIRPAPFVSNPLFAHEEAYASQTAPDAGLRLLALFRYWNMVEYFFPYRYAIGEDWQQVLPQVLPQVVAARSAEQYRLAMLALIARIHDTHANIYGDKVLEQYKGLYQAPLWLRFVDGQATVAGYYDATLGPATTLKPGDVVVQVEGQPVADLVKARRPITPASNEPTQLRNIARDLLRGPTKQVSLVVRRAGREFPVTVDRWPLSQLNLNLGVRYNTLDPKASPWKLLPGNVGYLALGTLHLAELPGIMAQAQGTKGLVIDLRNYPAEFVLQTLGKYLVSKPTPFGRFSGPDVTYPGVFRLSPVQYLAAGRGPVYPGKVIILVDEVTQSQAEYTALALRTIPRATVVGSTTAGADGDISSIVLPGNVQTYISGLGVYYADGRETQRIGIVPGVEVPPTIKGLSEGRDEVLERAVQLIEAA
ncbi:peptidase S41 [Hymenobacter sp. RP-2-7]|uniref:Peptidase S41 n=1 Tax=Hymenobacter polaris TaxID=2682546 RepID=A0A7Y0FP12_9BACT|nr:S41 family peptidase [Hymenobacter polaris]NML67156.1 peptidase S41 [Hymenobacter polaris]